MNSLSYVPIFKFIKKIIIGIDISCKTLDICLKQGEKLSYSTIYNELTSIKGFFKKYTKDEVVVAMENTGRYNWNLFKVLPGFGFEVYVISPLHLKKVSVWSGERTIRLMPIGSACSLRRTGLK